MLKEFESFRPFKMTFVKCDTSRKRGGEVETWECKRYVPQSTPMDNGRRLTEMEVMEIRELEGKKQRNRAANFTRSVVLMQDGIETRLIRDFHPPLVLTFNEKKLVP